VTTVAHSFDALILGGGAAGLMCAMEAGKRGRRVAVLERGDRIGKKILISGGGRCNFTNIHCRTENFISANPHFAKSALARYTPSDFIAMVEKHKIPYHEKTLGQLFCDGSAREIVEMLEHECRDAGVRTFANTSIQEILKLSYFVLRAGETEFRAPILWLRRLVREVAQPGCESEMIRRSGFYSFHRETAFGLTLPEKFALHCRLAGERHRLIWRIDV